MGIRGINADYRDLTNIIMAVCDLSNSQLCGYISNNPNGKILGIEWAKLDVLMEPGTPTISGVCLRGRPRTAREEVDCEEDFIPKKCQNMVS